MIHEPAFRMNLELVNTVKEIKGSIVECGVWRGGMIAAMAEIFGSNRNYYLFDSFEGLPAAKQIDGIAALNWQANSNNPGYHDNCRAEMDYAIKAMEMALPGSEKNVFIKKGWFHETMVAENLPDEIAVLRLDADWYDSTMTCLSALFNRVVSKGLIIIDDYYTWDGCSRAVHDFLSMNQCAERVFQWNNIVAFIKRKGIDTISA